MSRKKPTVTIRDYIAPGIHWNQPRNIFTLPAPKYKTSIRTLPRLQALMPTKRRLLHSMYNPLHNRIAMSLS